MAMWDFSFGMFGWALLHLWHRSSIASTFSSLLVVVDPFCSISSITSTESRKNDVVKEFQCFLFFKLAELKSWLMMWRCNCRIDGTCNKKKHVKLSNEVITLQLWMITCNDGPVHKDEAVPQIKTLYFSRKVQGSKLELDHTEWYPILNSKAASSSRNLCAHFTPAECILLNKGKCSFLTSARESRPSILAITKTCLLACVYKEFC